MDTSAVHRRRRRDPPGPVAWPSRTRATPSARPPTARTGLAAFRTSPPDLVLLDLRLPDMSGFDVCRALRGREHRADHHDHRPDRHPRHGGGSRGRRRRLRHQAGGPQGARRPHPGVAAPDGTPGQGDRRRSAVAVRRHRGAARAGHRAQGRRRGQPDQDRVPAACASSPTTPVPCSRATSCSSVSGATSTSATPASSTPTSAGCASRSRTTPTTRS